jgi:hypothetical protein
MPFLGATPDGSGRVRERSSTFMRTTRATFLTGIVDMARAAPQRAFCTALKSIFLCSRKGEKDTNSG